ncbi:hypothetical protein PFMALIP_04736 [Plasmodium falciparum MaliPS096_E11]|uniref:RRM domain-containing protein n=1 Tax=Plasmodium falciparum MaliPS096_E11 TaxID=1036727 RepID=A0A024WKZ7_PLAFA|nr:hypothetical protein PFMALIP_04736 [Plasmodium falciparum MaliPS096_E11]
MIFGTINNIIIDKDINIYAFIQYNDTEASQKAIEVMNGKEINGKLLKVTSRKIVDECIDMNTNKLDSQQKSQSSNDNKKTTLFVFYLPPHWNDQDLFDKFKTFGNLESATVAKKNDKTSKGYGFVVYTDPHSAALAISNMNKVEVYTGKRLKSYNSPPPPPPPMSCHGNESSNYANNEMYSIQNTMPNNRYNSRVSTNDVHQSFINTQYGHFPYNFFKNNEQGPYMQRSYNKTYNNMGKT